MLFILLSITATLIPSIAYGSWEPEDEPSDYTLIKLIRPHIYDNTTSRILANVGDSVQFECYATGTPGANVSIEWSRSKYIYLVQETDENRPLPNGEMVHYGNILNFSSVKPEHAGSYDCTAYEDYTLPGSRSYFLFIKSKPSIRNAVIIKEFEENNVINLITLYIGNSALPYGKLTWYKNGEVLNDTDKYRIRTSKVFGTSLLHISPKDNDYHGTYKYYSENELGQAEYYFEI